MGKITDPLTRRGILHGTSASLGLGLWTSSRASASAASASDGPKPREKRLPREVWVGTITQSMMTATDYKDMMHKMLKRLEEMVSYEPDIICLPEVFAFE